ncbi:MAG: hypothetical protein M0Z69_12895, partial [Actinomycetota bacterium]|nr:hypothetical protein [Actinomycetota bacterium]
GRDRIPREAALSGCVVIVANRGAAANDVDVPLAPQYKVDLPRSRGSVAELRRLLEMTRSEIGRHRRAQRGYRQAIIGQEAQFRAEVDGLLSLLDGDGASPAGGWSAEVR